MAIVVVGGHTRNIGKTGVMAGVIASLPELAWTAIKITQFGHGVLFGPTASPATARAQTTPSRSARSATLPAVRDTSRYLGAGRCAVVLGADATGPACRSDA